MFRSEKSRNFEQITALKMRGRIEALGRIKAAGLLHAALPGRGRGVL